MITVENLNVMFGTGKNTVQAVRNASFTVGAGESYGLVGESGSGKSTVLRAIAGLNSHWTGRIVVDGVTLKQKRPRAFRKLLQMVFQDPFGSLHPRHTVDFILKEPLAIHKFDGAEQRILKALDEVGLGPEFRFRYPHQLSGGQRQRIAIARALSVSPELVIGDEPVSALDVSIQAQILNLFRDLQQEFELTYLFIAHDLSVIRHISDRVAVMYIGKIVETGPVDRLFAEPLHPYTKALLLAVPEADPTKPPPKLTLKGEVSTPIDPPPGCRLCGRCPLETAICSEVTPVLKDMGQGRHVACHNI